MAFGPVLMKDTARHSSADGISYPCGQHSWVPRGACASLRDPATRRARRATHWSTGIDSDGGLCKVVVGASSTEMGYFKPAQSGHTRTPTTWRGSGSLRTSTRGSNPPCTACYVPIATRSLLERGSARYFLLHPLRPSTSPTPPRASHTASFFIRVLS